MNQETAIAEAVPTFPPDNQVEQIEAGCLKLPQADCPVTNHFAPGVYWREVSIPVGVFAIGHRHKQGHLNVLLVGKIRVLRDGQVVELSAPLVFPSPPGTRKLVYAVEPTRFANVHANPTDEQDVDKLELLLVEKSAAWLAHAQEINQLINPERNQ